MPLSNGRLIQKRSIARPLAYDSVASVHSSTERSVLGRAQLNPELKSAIMENNAPRVAIVGLGEFLFFLPLLVPLPFHSLFDPLSLMFVFFNSLY